MKNQKGFTMVELMAVIVVIGIIALIAIPVYHGTSERMKQKAYENKVSDIETKAESFAESTNRLLISVQDLVDAGKLEADNEEGDILSPIDNERMNCYIIETVLKDGSYESMLTDENNCDTADRIANNQDLKLVAKIGTREINPENWQGQDVILEARFVQNEEQYENVTYKWLHINEEISGEIANIYKTKTDTVTNNIFTVAVHAIKAGEEVNLTKSVRVKVDKQPPIVDQVGTKVLSPDTWALQKDIQLRGIDYNGSGIKGFYVYSGKNVGCTNDNTQYENKASIKVGTGVQHVCTMDNAGNVSEPFDVLIDNLDFEKPKVTVSISPSNETWYWKDKTIILYGTDDKSGIYGYYFSETSIASCPETASSYTNTRSYTKPMGTYYACVRDNAGNVSLPYAFNVERIDLESPYVEGIRWLNEEYNLTWQNYFPYTFTLTFKDRGGSGVQYVDVCEMPNHFDWDNKICRKIYPEEGVPIQVTTNTSYTELIIRDHAGRTSKDGAAAPVDIIKPWSPFVSAIGPYDTSDYIDNYNNCIKTNTVSECEALYGNEGYRRDVSDIITCDYFGNGVAAENHCTVYANKYPNYIPWPYFSDSTDDWMQYSNYSAEKGWYYMREDKNGNVVYPKTFFEWSDIVKPRQWYNADGTTEYFWGLDNAGNEGYKLIVKYVR